MGTKCFKMQQMVALCSSLVSILPEEEEEGGRGGSSAEPLPSVVFCLSENSSTGLFGLLSLRGSFCFITRPLFCFCLVGLFAGWAFSEALLDGVAEHSIRAVSVTLVMSEISLQLEVEFGSLGPKKLEHRKVLLYQDILQKEARLLQQHETRLLEQKRRNRNSERLRYVTLPKHKPGQIVY